MYNYFDLLVLVTGLYIRLASRRPDIWPSFTVDYIGAPI